MDLSQIRELLTVVAESNVEELTVEEEDLKITVRKSAPSISMQPAGGYPAYPPPPPQGYAPPPQAQPPAQQQPPPPQPPAQPATGTPGEGGDAGSGASGGAAAPSGATIEAPIVGTFYRRPSPEDPPFVEVGDTVAEGDVLCIIEAMKLMNEIECETPGTIQEILVEDGEPVEYEQPLFVIGD